MGEKKKKVKGGFRATLALVISIIALIFSIVAYNHTGTQSHLKADMKNLHQRIKAMKQETSERLDKARQETGVALQKIGRAIKKQESER